MTRRRGPSLIAVAGPPLGVLAIVIGVWYAVSYLVLDDEHEFLLPPLHEVIRVSFFERRNLDELLRGLGSTAHVAAVGFLVAVAIGSLWAVAMSQARWIERSLYPYAVVLQTIPILALVPVIGFWFDYNFRSRVVVCVLIALFPVITNTLFGLQSADRSHHDLFTLHGAGRLTRLRKLELPAALPAFFTGLRISAGLSVMGAIVGDFFFRRGRPGIGALLQRYGQRLQSEQMLGALMLSSLLGLAAFWLLGWLGRRVVGRWLDTGRDPR